MKEIMTLVYWIIHDNAHALKIPDNLKHSIVNAQMLQRIKIRRNQFEKTPARIRKERLPRVQKVIGAEQIFLS